jgi:hypothetical protein
LIIDNDLQQKKGMLSSSTVLSPWEWRQMRDRIRGSPGNPYGGNKLVREISATDFDSESTRLPAPISAVAICPGSSH